jgi:hypothetical protein
VGAVIQNLVRYGRCRHYQHLIILRCAKCRSPSLVILIRR